jgi:hypothetical protein
MRRFASQILKLNVARRRCQEILGISSSATAVELRRLFPGLANNENTRICARTIAGWKPLPEQGGVGEPGPATVRAAACQIARLRPRTAARTPGSSTP